MLNENIRKLRKSKGLSQEELAIKLNVVRQTVSKWERGLSVPDAEMLLSLSEVFDTPVSALLGKTVIASEPESLQALSEKLEVLNAQFARAQELKRRSLEHAVHIARRRRSPYPPGAWDDWGIISRLGFHQPRIRDRGHHAPRLRVDLRPRIAPFILIAAIAGAIATRKGGIAQQSVARLATCGAG